MSNEFFLDTAYAIALSVASEAPHLDGEVFEPLKDREQLQKRSTQL